MGKASREKGKRGERELAALLTEAGFPAERAQQYKGNAGSFDVTCPSLERLGLVIEVKNVARPTIGPWLAKAEEDAGPLQEPVVFWRKPRGRWYAILPAEAFLASIKKG